MQLTFGSSLRRLRKRKGLTLQQVADEMDVKYPAVQQWETDKTIPNYDKLEKLSRVLGAEINTIYPRPGSDYVIEYTEELLQICIDSFEEKTNFEAEGFRLSRDPFMYALFMKHKKDLTESINWYVSTDREPSRHQYLRIYRTKPIGDSNKFEITNKADGFAEKPYPLKMMKTPFGIYMPNDSMVPKFEVGDLILFDDIPKKDHIGYALICHRNEDSSKLIDCCIAKVVAQNDKTITAFVISSMRHIEIPRANTTLVFRVLEMSDVVDPVQTKE